MAGIFISYSRLDKDFVLRLHAALKEQGHEPWVDWEGILPSAEWLQEIYSAIDANDFFLYVLSPNSVASEICDKEVAHAAANHKRLIPLVIKDVKASEVSAAAAAHNWIFCREQDDFAQSLQTLFKAFDTDIDWVHDHTRLLTRSLDWASHNRDNSFALRGHDLQRAEQWLSRAAEGKQPRPTTTQTDFILASRKDVSRRQRTVAEALLVGFIIVMILGFNAWEHMQRGHMLQGRELFSKGIGAINDNDAAKAELLLAESLSLDDERETRERFMEAHAKTAALEWSHAGDEESRMMAVSADGSRFAVYNGKRQLELWDTASHRKLNTLPFAKGTYCAAFSRDDRWFATGGDDRIVRVWELSKDANGPAPVLRHILSGHQRAIRCVAFSPDDQMLASGGKGGVVRLWNVPQGRQLRELPSHLEQVLCLAFSPDGKTLASGSWGNEVWLRDVNTGRKIRELHGHEDAIFGLAFSPDGNTLASASWDTTVWLWDAHNGERLRQLTGHKGGVLAVAFSGDSREVLSSGEDGTARIWDTDSGREALTLRGQDNYVRYVALGRTQRDLVAGSSDGTVRVWDVAGIGERKEVLTLRGHSGYVRAVAFSPDDKKVVTGSEDLSVQQWDSKSGQPLHALTGHHRGIYSIFYRPDGKQFASAAKDGTVRLWDSQSGKCDMVLRHPAPVRHVEFSPTEPLVAVACDDGHIYLWNANSSRLVRVLASGNEMVLCIAFNHNGRTLASSGEDRRVLLWDVTSGQKIATMRGHEGPVWDVVFSADDQTLFSCSEDETVRVWDVKSRVGIGEMHGHSGSIWDLAWNAQRNMLASAGQDGTVRLWKRDGENWQTHLVLRASSGPIWGVSFSHDGKRLLAGSQDRTARLWQLDEVEKVLTVQPDALISQSEKETGLRGDNS